MTKRSRWTSKGNPTAQGYHQHDGRPTLLFRRGSDARGPAKSAPKANWGGKRKSKCFPARGRILQTNGNFMAGNLTSQVRKYRRSHDGRRERGLSRISPWTSKGKSSNSRTRSIQWWTNFRSFAAEVTRVRARSAPKANLADKRKSAALPVLERPTDS